MMALLLVSGAIFAQSPIAKGKMQINAGVGVSTIGAPFYVGLDYGVHSDITVGGELSYRSYNEYRIERSYKSSIIGVLGNANYHFNKLLKIPKQYDIYAGLNLGFYVWNSPRDYIGVHEGGLGLGGQIGGRYYFNNKLGINLEIGGSNALSAGKFGVSVKL